MPKKLPTTPQERNETPEATSDKTATDFVNDSPNQPNFKPKKPEPKRTKTGKIQRVRFMISLYQSDLDAIGEMVEKLRRTDWEHPAARSRSEFIRIAANEYLKQLKKKLK